MGHGDEYLAQDGMGDEEGCRDIAHPNEPLKAVEGERLDTGHTAHNHQQRHHIPGGIGHAACHDEAQTDCGQESPLPAVPCGKRLHALLQGEAGQQQSRTKGQYTADAVVAQTVEQFALRLLYRLHHPAEGNDGHNHAPVAAVETETVEQVELQHQTEEPVGTRPDDSVGMGQHVDVHQQLGHDMLGTVMERTGCDGIHHGEGGKAQYHHVEQFLIVVADKAPAGQILFPLIFHHQAIAAEKEEERHTVVSQKRHRLHRQIEVGLAEMVPEARGFARGEGILVFLDCQSQPVAIVVKDDGEDGESAQGCTFRAAEPCLLIVHVAWFWGSGPVVVLLLARPPAWPRAPASAGCNRCCF